MDLPALISFGTFAVIAAFTPGPNNVMLTASGANFGFQRTLPHILGITIGFSCLVFAAGFGLAELFAMIPKLYKVMHYLSISYLLYLAWKIGTAKRLNQTTVAKPMTFIQAATFQIINPKAVSVIISATTAYVSGAGNLVNEVLTLVFVFFIITLPATITWALFGSIISNVLKNDFYFKVFNVTMALLLILSLSPILL